VLSVAVMAHPSRSAFVETLVPELPGAEVVWDEKNDRWDTGRRSLLAYDPRASHHVVVQDDAILCRDFLGGVEAAAAVAGESPIGLYTGRVRPHQNTITPTVRRALAQGAPFMVAPGPYWGVALVIPTAHIDELVAWGDGNPTILNYDRRIAAWYEQQAVECWYTVPSLVDHRPVDENPSLISGRVGNRRAHRFCTGSALDIDWTRPPAHMNRTVVYRHRKTGEVRRVIEGSTRDRNLARTERWDKEPQTDGTTQERRTGRHLDDVRVGGGRR
jgi:hypothetical protein